MKKILSFLLLAGIILPVFAATDDAKYQIKIEKERHKQELKCLKHPEKCMNTTPVKEQTFTLGLVQKEVKIGTSQTDVISALGSPNIITKDSDGKDTWVYDKIASITAYNSSGFSVGALGGGLGAGNSGGGGGILGVGYGKNSGNTQTSEKTLTVVIKFDKTSKVESFTYHMSSF